MSRRRLLRAGGISVLGIRLRAPGRARGLLQGVRVHRLDQPDHIRQQPIAVQQQGSYVKERSSIDFVCNLSNISSLARCNSRLN